MGFIDYRRTIRQVNLLLLLLIHFTTVLTNRCVTKPCYHLLRRTDIAKNPVVKENLPLILTIMINKFEHARGLIKNEERIFQSIVFVEASIQFIQAVKLYDSNSNLLITVLNSLLIDYQDTSLAIELLKFVSIFLRHCLTNLLYLEKFVKLISLLHKRIMPQPRPWQRLLSIWPNLIHILFELISIRSLIS